MQSYHIAGHDLDLLESYVHDCVQQLPKLQTTSDEQLPPRCAAYHTACSTMLKHALAVLEQLSPRLGRLVAQIWDLASLNCFVLVQLAHSSVTETAALQMRARNAEQFDSALATHHAKQQQRRERELDALRLEAMDLRAELQTTRQKHNRVAVENAQLRLAIQRLVDPNEPLAGGAGSAPSDDHTMQHIDFERDVAVVGDTEERELYGAPVNAIETLSLIESVAMDVDVLFDALASHAQQQMATLNALDRFMDSRTVSLLWQYGSSDDEHQRMHKMLSAQSVACQTDAVRDNVGSRRLATVTDNDDDQPLDLDDDPDDVGDNDSEAYAGGETGNATVVTKRQTLPATLRAQLTTRPTVPRVLDVHALSRFVLRLYLEKLDADAVAIRTRQPRPALHAFMKQLFVARFGIVHLADYHVLEVVKSCLVVHARLDAERDRVGALGIPTLSLVGVYPHANTAVPDSVAQLVFAADDVRVALFSRVCELVPLEVIDVPVGGNLFTSLMDAVVDVLGDVVELDAAMQSLEHVLTLSDDDKNDWTCASELATALMRHHLVFADRSVLDDANAQLARCAKLASTGLRVQVDIVLAVFATAWLEHDQRLTRKLRDGFRRQLVALSSTRTLPVGSDDSSERRGDFARRTSTSDNTTSTELPVERLVRVCATLPDESLSPLDLDALRTAFESLVAANDDLASASRSSARRATTSTGKKRSVALSAAPATVCIGGVSEKAFVAATVQLLRVRRTAFGIRTHSRAPSAVPARLSQLGASRQLVALLTSHDHTGNVPLEMLKPGLTRDASHSSSSNDVSE